MKRVFNDRKAERRFLNLYQSLTKKKQKVFGQMVRDLADKKITGDGDEFYITLKDVVEIYCRL